jgi:large subunit ribosomal protein L24|uniref:Large ribosomal subunit protein uL24c n=1 Tax=Vaucheria litorea TaxID=109269 RepID=B7T1X3_VAULI|nr:ribosomal protein L24 [Vaucheria litorea]ACF70939.1 ribosomal protein L24 [Vaucheria litorea]
MKKLAKVTAKIHVKLHDKVKIISGQNKGQIGIIKIIFKKKSQVIIEGINIKSKHLKQNQSNENGQIQRLEFPIHSSNVQKYKE